MTMEAGRELDSLIEQAIFGNKVRHSKDLLPHMQYLVGNDILPNYSTKIEDAWKVVERLSKGGIYFRLSNVTGAGKFRVAYGYGITDFCETASEAICLAALELAEYLEWEPPKFYKDSSQEKESGV